ncbi:transposase [Streptomyces sp. NPDC091412]|uniref:transposase n=1 Tax=Streptomyces sp. NPDC091412 TaxID=3366002 RepID=UPI003826F989
MKVDAANLGIGSAETMRTWVRKAEVDAGRRPGVTSEEAAEIKRLRAENAELRRANELLKAASASTPYAAKNRTPPVPGRSATRS